MMLIKVIFTLVGGAFMLFALAVQYYSIGPADNSYFSLIFFLAGTPFFLAGLFMIIKGMRRKKEIEFLKTNGRAIYADVKSVDFNTSISINGKSPYQIICQWTNKVGTKVYIFKSENIWFDPSEYIKGEQLKVFIDSNNPSKYYVDQSFLPELVE